MSTILPPVPTGQAAPPPPAAPVLTVAGGAAAAEIATLPVGSLLEAVVLPQPGQARNLLEVVTSAGTLMLRIRNDGQLPGGANLVLQVMPGDGQTTLKLTAVNGRSLLPGFAPTVSASVSPSPLAGLLASGGQATTTTTTTLAAATTAATANAGEVPGVVPPSVGFTATLLRPASGQDPGQPSGSPAAATANAATAGLSPDMAPGTRLTLRIAGVTPPDAATPDESATALPDATSPATTPKSPAESPHSADPAAPAPASPAPNTAPVPTAANTAAPVPGAAAAEPDASVPPPAAPLTAAAEEPPPPTLTGTVLDHAPGGQALVQTPIGTLSLPSALPLAPGSILDLRVVGPPLPPLPGPSTNPAPLAPGWPALSDAIETLAAQANGEAASQLSATLPQLNTQLAANLSLFASAIEAGEEPPLLGEKVVGGLERAGRRDLVGRLKDDVRALSAKATRPLGEHGEWRGFSLPMLLGAEIEPIQLYVQRPPRDEDSESGGRKGDEHRFLVEVTLTRMGRIQFDGLVQRDTKRFDLIIRTAEPMSEQMRHDIMGLFAQTSDAVGTKGSVVFHSGGRFLDLPPTGGGTRLMV